MLKLFLNNYKKKERNYKTETFGNACDYTPNYKLKKQTRNINKFDSNAFYLFSQLKYI